VSVATVAAGLFMLNANATLIAIPLIAFSLGWLTYRFGTVPAVIVALVAGALAAALGPALFGSSVLDGLYVAVAALAAGPVAAMLLRRFPAINVAFGVALVITAAFMVAPIGAATMKASVAALTDLMAALRASGSAPVFASKANTDSTVAQTIATWPASVFYTLGIGTAIGVSLAGRAGRSLGQSVNRYGTLADIDVSFHIVWPTIAGLALAAVGSLLTKAPALVGNIGTNALMFVRPLLFFQGLAVFASLYRKMGAGRIIKAIGLVLLVLTELFVPSVSILGLVDLFMNLRKLPRGRDALPGGVA
jgi:uncharacterized protein YybS (DUF2232 family)